MTLCFYSPAPRLAGEERRQRQVDASGVLAAAGDPILKALALEAAERFSAPIAAVSIVDRTRQYFPVAVGLAVDQTPRACSFCAHAILRPDEVLCVPDAALDTRFAGNPLVLSGPGIRFYAGAPLLAGDGLPLGALCVIDTVPRPRLQSDEEALLAALARRAVARIAEL